MVYALLKRGLSMISSSPSDMSEEIHHRYMCSNSQKYIVWVKIINFSLMPKIIKVIKIMFHEDIL